MKKKNDYFQMLVELAKYSDEAARCLKEALENFSEETLTQSMERLHHIEHCADEGKHELVSKLAVEFITPIEREDILLLAEHIDDVTDFIEDVLKHIYMYRIDTIIPEAMQFCDLLVRCCSELQHVVTELPKLKKSSEMHQRLVEVDRLETEGDQLYLQTMRALSAHKDEPLFVISWGRVFGSFEKCYDSCEDICDVVQTVLITNS